MTRASARATTARDMRMKSRQALADATAWTPRERRLGQALMDMGVVTTYIACPHTACGVLCTGARILLEELGLAK